MNGNISNNALNRLISTRFVKNESLYESAEYVFSTSVFMPSDMVILNNQKVYTYLTGLIHLVETFNARVNAYIPPSAFNPQNHALVIFFDKMFNEAGYYTNNAPLNINNKFTKKRLFSNTHYNPNNLSDIQALFRHIKAYLNHIAASADPKYSNIVLVEYDMNYNSALNTGIHAALHSNFNTIGMMARFLPLFDYTKLATFIINCNYALTPNYLALALEFIQSTCIIYPVTENYAFSDFNSPDPNYTFSVFVKLFPEILDSVRYLGGFFGIKNQIVHSMDNALFVDIPMHEFAAAKFNISRPPTSWSEITDKMSPPGIKQTISSNIDLINLEDNSSGAPFKQFSIQQRIDDFIDLIYELRDTENPHAYINKNINIGTEYITDELFLSWVFDVFSKIFVNSANMNFAHELPTVAEYIENSEILAQSPRDKQAAIEHAIKVGIHTVPYNEYIKLKPKLNIYDYKQAHPELTPMAFKMLYSIETNSYTNTISRQLSYNIIHNTFDFHDIYAREPYVNGLLYEIKFDDSILDFTLAPNDKIREFLETLRTNAYYYLSRSLFTNPAVKRSRPNEANNGFNNGRMPNTKRARLTNRRNKSAKLIQKNNIGQQTKDPVLAAVLNYFRTKRSFCTMLSSFDMDKNMVLWSPTNDNETVKLLKQYPEKYKFFNIHDITIQDIINYVHTHSIIRPY